MADVGEGLAILYELILSLRSWIPPTVGLALLLFGIFVALFGRKIFRVMLFLVGGVLFGGLFFGLYSYVAEGVTISSYVMGVIGFILGGVFVVGFFYLVIFMIGASIGTLLGLLIFAQADSQASTIAIAIISMIFGVLAVIIFEISLAISTSITGGFVAGVGALILVGNLDATNLTNFGVAATGIVFQLFFLDAFEKRVWSHVRGELTKPLEKLEGFLASTGSFGRHRRYGSRKALTERVVEKPTPEQTKYTIPEYETFNDIYNGFMGFKMSGMAFEERLEELKRTIAEKVCGPCSQDKKQQYEQILSRIGSVLKSYRESKEKGEPIR